jgi:hypothetical protein
MHETLAMGGAFAGVNNVHPLGLAALAAGCVAVVVVRRALVPVAFLCVAAFVPSAQRVVVAGADFNFIRLLVVAGMLRVLLRREIAAVAWNWFDAAALSGALLRIGGYFASRGDGGALVTAIGSNFEIVGSYVVFRSCIRDRGDVEGVLRGAAVVAMLAAPFFVLESSTGRNLFSVFGGVPETTMLREGRLRCQGAIAHPILAGCFFATFTGLWIAQAVARPGRDRLLAAGGLVAAATITFCCASSTPVVAFLQAAVAWAFLPMRRWLRFAWGALAVVAMVLHVAMNKPVWFLIARIDAVGGSTGWHRSHLIDGAVRHVGEWWLHGTRSTAHWGWGLEDVTNQFILDGVHGGLGALLALVALFVLGFAWVGVRIRREAAGPEAWLDARLAFGLGAVLFAQLGIFTAVSYFGQTIMVWQLVLAMAASLPAWRGAESPRCAGPSPAASPARPPRREDGRRRVASMPWVDGVGRGPGGEGVGA